SGPISRHQERKAGCHFSSARCKRLSCDKLTLFGIFSSKATWLIALLLSIPRVSGAFPIEIRPLPRLAVEGERARLARGVRPDEAPVLPGGEPAEDLRFHRLGTNEPEVCLHARERVGAHGRPLLDRQADLLVPVELVGGEGDQPRLQRLLRVEAAAVLD